MPATLRTLDAFTRAYIEAGLFSSTDDDGEPLDARYTLDNIAPETLAAIVEDCRRFQEIVGDAIAHDVEHAGRDFWYTRHGHGCGFWDGDWADDLEERLTAACTGFERTEDLYVGDDGRLYL